MTTNIATLKNRLSSYLRDVQDGAEVIVLDRQRPVARIVPYRQPEKAGLRGAGRRTDADLDEMARRGAISHRGTPADMAAWLKSHRPVKTSDKAPALSDIVLTMREEERW